MALRILVADDSTTIQKVIKIAFAQYDLQVATSSSHVELLREVAQERPDVMIVDALLPGMKGPEAFKQLFQDWGVPLLILVGSYESVEEAPFRAIGFNHILRKPFGSADVVKAVGDALGREIPLVGAGESVSSSRAVQTPAAGLPPPPPAFNLARSARPTATSGVPFALSLNDSDTDGMGHSLVPPPPPAPPSMPSSMMTEPRFDIGLATPPPPPPAADESRRGRRAFDDEVTPSPVRSKPPIPTPSSHGRPSDMVSELTDAVLKDVQSNVFVPPPPPPPSFGGMTPGAVPFPPKSSVAAPVATKPSEDELRQLVREAVEDYCSKNFPAVAREVITAEIRRLAEERARHMAE